MQFITKDMNHFLTRPKARFVSNCTPNPVPPATKCPVSYTVSARFNNKNVYLQLEKRKQQTLLYIPGPAISKCAHARPGSTKDCKNAAAVHAPPLPASPTPSVSHELPTSAVEVRMNPLKLFGMFGENGQRPHALVDARADLSELRFKLPTVACENKSMS